MHNNTHTVKYFSKKLISEDVFFELLIYASSFVMNE